MVEGQGSQSRRADRHRRRAHEAPTESPQFDQLVGQLVEDPSWRRRVARVHLRHRCSTALCWTLRGFGELGCWFTAVPTHRCGAPTAPIATRRAGT